MRPRHKVTIGIALVVLAMAALFWATGLHHSQVVTFPTTVSQ